MTGLHKTSQSREKGTTQYPHRQISDLTNRSPCSVLRQKGGGAAAQRGKGSKQPFALPTGRAPNVFKLRVHIRLSGSGVSLPMDKVTPRPPVAVSCFSCLFYDRQSTPPRISRIPIQRFHDFSANGFYTPSPIPWKFASLNKFAPVLYLPS